jgi:hypothetical protein
MVGKNCWGECAAFLDPHFTRDIIKLDYYFISGISSSISMNSKSTSEGSILVYNLDSFTGMDC